MVLTLPEATTRGVVEKKILLKVLQYSHENRFFFQAATLLKTRLRHRSFLVNIGRIFRLYFFLEHPWMNLSILQQLLAVYFEIIYRWQLSSSEKSLVAEKIIHMFQGFYRFRFLLHTQTHIYTHIHTNTHTHTDICKHR